MHRSSLGRGWVIAISSFALVITTHICAAQTGAPVVDYSAARAAVKAHEAQKAAASNRRQAMNHASTATAAQLMQSAIKSKDLTVNMSRAYPPSCLADGAQNLSPGDDPNAQQGILPLVGEDAQGNARSATYAVSVWRVPCSGGVSATLLRIVLSPLPTSYPTGSYVHFPNITLTSISSGVSFFPRLPEDPNTTYSDTLPMGMLFAGGTYVLDYLYGESPLSAPDFNQAFRLNIDNLATPDSNITLTVPAYNPATFNNYPSAANPLEISGYVSGPWYDPVHPGEGMLIEVYDVDYATRVLAATWFTFDDLGLPFWLAAQTLIPIQYPGGYSFTSGYGVVDMPIMYPTGGGFAGNFSGPVQDNLWGTMSLTFPDCNTLDFSYNGAAGKSAIHGPAGSGTREWHRLAGINNAICQ